MDCNCRVTNDRSIFTGSYLALPQKLYGWLPVHIDYRRNPTLLTVFLLLILLFIFTILFIFAGVLDKNDETKKKALFLVDNRMTEQYMYIIVVVTGANNPSQTTSHIGIKIFGSRANSKRHVLVGVRDERTLVRLGIDFFALTTYSALGRIRAIEVWSDNRGSSPDWFCEKIIVRDYKAMVEWVFMVRKWFSLIRGDERVHRILYQTKLRTPTLLDRIFQVDDFYIHHIWFGMFFREHCHAFSRKYKVLMAYLLLNLSFLFSLFMYGIPQIQRDAVYDEGHIHINRIITVGIISLLLAIIVVYPIMYILKNSEVDPEFNYYYYDFSGIDPTIPLPVYFFPFIARHVMWGVIAGLIVLTYSIVIWIGPSFGTRKSQMALYSLIVAFLIDFIFVETIHIIVRGIIWRGIYFNPHTQRFCNQIVDTECEFDIPLANNSNKQVLLKKDMFWPMRTHLIRTFRERERSYNLYSALFKDFLMYLFFILFLILIMVRYRDSMAFYNSDIMNRIFVEARFTNTQPLENISSFQEVFDYINYTVLLNTFWQPPSWLSMANSKLIGVIRIRQHRISERQSECVIPDNFIRDMFPCQKKFSASIRDTESYNPRWSSMNKTYGYHPKVAVAFRYQTGEQTETFPIHTVNRWIPEGGYVVTLARSARNSRNILNMVRQYQWFDDMTRILIVDLVTFNAHANLFSLVTIIIERSMTGNFVTSEHIRTLVMERRHVMSNTLEYICYFILSLLIINILFHQSQSLTAENVFESKQYFWFLIDVAVLILAVLSISYAILRAIYQHNLLDLMSKSHKTYINFGYVASLDYSYKVVTSLLIFLSTIRMWKLLRFNSRLKMVEITVSFALVPIFSITIVMVVMLCMATLMIYLIFGTRCLIWWNYSQLPEVSLYYPEGKMTVTILYYLFWLGLKNMYVCIIMSSYRKARKMALSNKFRFTFGEYVNERIFKNDKSEHLRWRVIDSLNNDNT